MSDQATAHDRPPPALGDFPATGRNALGSILQRGVARVLDAVLLSIPMVLLTLPYLRLEGDEVHLDDIPWWVPGVQIVLTVLYETVLVRLWGRTVGKAALGLRVARYVDGGNPSLTQAAQRVLVPQAVAAIPLAVSGVLAMFVYLTATFDPLRRGIHDKASGTIVVRTR